MQRVRNPFSERSSAGIAELNSVARAKLHARAQKRIIVNLSDSNPTHCGLAPRSLPQRYDADPRGVRADRELLAGYLARWDSANDARATSHQCGASIPSFCTTRSAHSTRLWHSHGEPVDPDRLYLLSSTSQGYAWAMKVLCDPGDAILAPAPGYPLIEQIATLENVHVHYYPLAPYDSWAIDSDAVESLLKGDQSRRVKAIVLINPNNPTGSYVHSSEYSRIVRLCQEYGLAIIADEVFYRYCLSDVGLPDSGNTCAADGAEKIVHLAGAADVLTFALDGLSKQLAAPGAKVAWMRVSGPDAHVEEALARLDMVADVFLPWSQILSASLPQLLQDVPEQIKRVRARCLSNLQALHKIIQEDPCAASSVLPVEGGWNALLRFPAHIDEDALVQELLKHNPAISVQPGYFFDMPLAGIVSVSLLLEPLVFDQGIRHLLAAINAQI